MVSRSVIGTKLKMRGEIEPNYMFLAMPRRERRGGGIWMGKWERRDMGGLLLGVRRYVLCRGVREADVMCEVSLVFLLTSCYLRSNLLQLIYNLSIAIAIFTFKPGDFSVVASLHRDCDFSRNKHSSACIVNDLHIVHQQMFHSTSRSITYLPWTRRCALLLYKWENPHIPRMLSKIIRYIKQRRRSMCKCLDHIGPQCPRESGQAGKRQVQDICANR